MNTRAPAWCDRVLMNQEAWNQVSKDPKHVYNSIGQKVCMGDHKVSELHSLHKLSNSARLLGILT